MKQSILVAINELTAMNEANAPSMHPSPYLFMPHRVPVSLYPHYTSHHSMWLSFRSICTMSYVSWIKKTYADIFIFCVFAERGMPLRLRVMLRVFVAFFSVRYFSVRCGTVTTKQIPVDLVERDELTVPVFHVIIYPPKNIWLMNLSSSSDCSLPSVHFLR